MRGKASQYGYDSYENRITPAYAGKRKNTVKTTKGEYGSPPPMRGKATTLEVDKSSHGITPAYAGKSFAKQKNHATGGITPAYAGKRPLHFRQSCDRWDHPRLCGEKCVIFVIMLKGGGSPPPMRGKDIAAYAKKYKSRITPAYAGKSLAYRITSTLFLDHPRLCGEKL